MRVRVARQGQCELHFPTARGDVRRGAGVEGTAGAEPGAGDGEPEGCGVGGGGFSIARLGSGALDCVKTIDPTVRLGSDCS